ncbi:MAG TPA: 4Fe-4S binding protein [Candidatus Limiplasma sp.]|nr:4Fe-4S binding protein [Candidatus Limiplasma sp.]HRX09171.1 4Fe-4S binding protein [Candidatus Limiplasma sp.]
MKRNIVVIDEEKCNGCGQCVDACHEGAIALVDGKARLLSESYCDGLGACLPHCPMDAITIEEREAAAFDEAYAMQHQQEKLKKEEAPQPKPMACGCPGTHSRAIERTQAAAAAPSAPMASELRQWPCQIKLAPVSAPYFHQANLLIAASCTAYAYANVHSDYMKNRVTLIGCPKLDGVDYAQKLAAILSANDIKSVTVLRMEVPCCGGIVTAVKNALIQSGKMLPWHVVTLSTDGKVLED